MLVRLGEVGTVPTLFTSASLSKRLGVQVWVVAAHRVVMVIRYAQHVGPGSTGLIGTFPTLIHC